MEITAILCILLLSLYLALVVFWIIHSILDVVETRKREKRTAQWEAERLQFERERAARDEEYHKKRMDQLKR
ncbi:MAG: hypothetical protein BWY15_01655 [Firmicutes bacterium ADurb.Bin193]|nr:MAG: hypothetical protein BWY15_01655 [Firmicutes bacterium ADurb.Bin193]